MKLGVFRTVYVLCKRKCLTDWHSSQWMIHVRESIVFNIAMNICECPGPFWTVIWVIVMTWNSCKNFTFLRSRIAAKRVGAEPREWMQLDSLNPEWLGADLWLLTGWKVLLVYYLWLVLDDKVTYLSRKKTFLNDLKNCPLRADTSPALRIWDNCSVRLNESKSLK